MESLYNELKRRKVFRVAAVYLVVCWLLVQVADIILPTFNAPLWINQTIVIVLLLGLPVVLVLAWALELTPEIEVDGEGPPLDYSIESANQKSGGILLGLIGLAVFFLFFDRYMLGVEYSVADSLGEAPLAVQSTLSRTYINLDKLEKRREGGYTSFDFTPDGQKIAYSSFSEGTYKLHTRDMSELESTTLLENDTGVFLPKISPDGQRILYWSQSKLFVIPIQGGPPQIITDTGVVPNSHAWMSSNSVVYTKNPDFSLHVTSISGEELSSFANGLNKNGLNKIGIYIDPEPIIGTDKVLYSVGVNDGEWQIHLVDITTGESTPLIQDGFEVQYMDTGYLTFIRDDFLWAVAFDLERLEVTGSESPIIANVQNVYNYAAAAYAISPQGRLVYLSGNSEYVNASYLVWQDDNGTQEVLGLEPMDYREITISPSGSKLAMTILQPGGGSDIWVYDFGMGILNRLTSSGGAMNPTWFPDEEYIVFNDIQTDRGLLTVKADGTGSPQRMTSEDILTGPGAFSPTGDRLIYIQGSHPAWDMKILRLDDDRLVRQNLISTQFEERQPAISPDGKWFAYVSHETDHAEIYVRPFPNIGDNKWKVTARGGEEPAWNVENGQLFLYYITRVDQQLKIVKIQVSTESGFVWQAPEVVTEISTIQTNEPSYAISPIDNRILLMQPMDYAVDYEQEIASQAVFVDNWWEEIESISSPNSRAYSAQR